MAFWPMDIWIWMVGGWVDGQTGWQWVSGVCNNMWADKKTDRWKPSGKQWKTDGVMDCWPKGVGQSRKSTEFDRKSIKIDGWVMARSGVCAHEKNRNVAEVLMKK